MNWYHQAGTPRLDVRDSYDPVKRTYTLTIRQTCPSTPEAKSENKKPFHIPFAMGLLGEAGALRLQLEGESVQSESNDNTNRVIELKQAEQSFVFTDIPERPVPSMLRGFSAPVKLDYDYSAKDLMRIMSMDDDGFCRWDASQKLAVLSLNKLIDSKLEFSGNEAGELLIEGYRLLLTDTSLDPEMVALMLDLPSEIYLGELQAVVAVDENYAARNLLMSKIATALKSEFFSVYNRCTEQLSGLARSVESKAIALRSLKNCTLQYLMFLDDVDAHKLCIEQIEAANNMTEVSYALSTLVNSSHSRLQEEKSKALSAFYQRWKHEPLVVNQWLLMQAKSPASTALQTVKMLMAGPVFDIKNPNKVRSLISVFANQNLVNFHHRSGEGYRFLADQILVLNKQNPQVASRLLTPLTKWRRYDEGRQQLMQGQLQRIMAAPDLSKDVYEVVSKSLV
jgi:aminopeptidase N